MRLPGHRGWDGGAHPGPPEVHHPRGEEGPPRRSGGAGPHPLLGRGPSLHQPPRPPGRRPGLHGRGQPRFVHPAAVPRSAGRGAGAVRDPPPVDSHVGLGRRHVRRHHRHHRDEDRGPAVPQEPDPRLARGRVDPGESQRAGRSPGPPVRGVVSHLQAARGSGRCRGREGGGTGSAGMTPEGASDDPEEPEEEREEGSPVPLPPEERESVEADLEDLDAMRSVFQPQGAKGVVIACSECGENHYYGWELLRESLEHMLETGEPRMHEPPYEPREDEYVVWDYGKGYVDALADSGLESTSRLEITACAWCETPIEA